MLKSPATHFPTSLSVKKIDKTLNFILPLLKFSFTFLFIYINMSGDFQFSTNTTTLNFSSDESSDEDDAKKELLVVTAEQWRQLKWRAQHTQHMVSYPNLSIQSRLTMLL